MDVPPPVFDFSVYLTFYERQVRPPFTGMDRQDADKGGGSFWRGAGGSCIMRGSVFVFVKGCDADDGGGTWF
jgi:hypothetical protein